ncbi:hypothetical protein V3N99_11495 [Dermatophilaceae bacterium Soc4.6]
MRCQCCFQGKDAARPTPQCCAIGRCCHEVASEWTVHQAWRVLRSALTQAMREEVALRNVAALVRVPVPRAKKSTVWSVDASDAPLPLPTIAAQALERHRVDESRRRLAAGDM